MYRYAIFAFPVLCFLGSGALAQTDAMRLTRQAAVQFALEHNPEIIAAQRVWEASKARIIQARSLPDPELELEFEELPGVTRTSDFGERSFGATQTIESPLKWWRRSQTAVHAAQATRFAVLEMTRLDIRSRVKTAYDRILFEDKRLEYMTQHVQLAQDFLKKARQRLEAGDVPQLEVLRAEVEAGRAENRLTKVRNDLSVAKATLNTLLARPSQAHLEVNGELAYRPIEVQLDDLTRLATKQRPDLLGADRAIESSRATHGLARAALLPDLSVGVFRQNIRGPDGDGNFWRMSFALDFPLWGAAQQRGQLSETRAGVKQALAEKDGIRNLIMLQIESAFGEVQTAGKQVELFQERILREADRSFEVANRSYTEGKATYLELLAAQQALIEVREEYASALFGYRSALYELERASGGPLQSIQAIQEEH